jgi:hypothetical protein
MRLRYAGLPDLELVVLLGHGTLDEVRLWMPALLEEGLDEPGQELVRARSEGDDEVAAWLREHVP